MRLEGSMSMDARDRMIEAFTRDPSVKVCFRPVQFGPETLPRFCHCQTVRTGPKK